MRFFPFLSRSRDQGSSRACGPEGARAYAIGDIHGRLDLLDRLLERIEADVRSRPIRRTHIIFLGDLVDRGPDSRGVVERLRNFRPDWARPVFLSGNHEEAFLRAIGGDVKIFQDWLRFGGAECLKSYGLDPQAFGSAPGQQVIDAARARVPDSHVRFLQSFADSLRFGDYLFVHAGIRPGVPLEEQKIEDLRWIREPFLSHEGTHGFTVVHGHTIVEEVEELPNRIGLDTGAYRSGRLTALGIEGADRWFLTAEAS